MHLGFDETKVYLEFFFFFLKEQAYLEFLAYFFILFMDFIALFSIIYKFHFTFS